MATTTDRRELILERVYDLLSELTIPILGGPVPAKITSIPAGNIVRNQNELDKAKVPGIILLDGDEVKDPRQQRPERGMVENGVPDSIMRMTPEIYVVLDVRDRTNENVGEDLNAARLAILGAVLPDLTLQSIVGGNGNIVYDGCVTDLAKNRQMKGQLGISITFNYPLIWSDYKGLPSP
jgi:hypothetical protein